MRNLIIKHMAKHLPPRRILFMASLLYFSLLAGTRKSYAQGLIQFQENKGQWNAEVRYRAQLPGGYIYLRQAGFTYSLLDPEDVAAMRAAMHGDLPRDSTRGNYVIGPGHPSGARRASAPREPAQPGRIRAHAYRVDFLGASPGVQLVGDHPAESRYNYLIGKDPAHWGRGVRGYGGVSYKGLYPHVDARLYSVDGGLKYDLIAYPGSRPEDIRLEYQGLERMELRKGQLYLTTSVGEVIEVAPYAYQVIGDQRIEVPCSYRLRGHILSFRVGARYDPAHPLVIDPRFIFSTFSGSTADNWGYTATYDGAGNFYMGGIVFGPGYPATTGAYQVSYGGGQAGGTYAAGFDISISKFSPDGRNLIYATYLGGSGNEQPQSLIVDGGGNLIIAGRTNAAASYPGEKVGPCGNWDIVLTRLNADGSALAGSLVIGGSGPDGINIADKYDTGPTGGAFTASLRRFYGDDARSEVNIDGAGNIILVGSTQSGDADASKGFPIRGGFQPTYGGGTQDGVVLKVRPDLSGIIWSSFLGGSANDAAYVVNFSNNGNLYVAGGTESIDFPIRGATLQTTYKGRVDGFIAEIRDDGSAIVRSTYLGTGQADQVYGIQSDKAGNVYVGGTTEGTWTVTPGTKTFGSPNGKQFISKLTPDLSSFVYSTVFGSSNTQAQSLPNISPTAFLVDRCENVYMAGWGGTLPTPGEVNSPEYPNAGTLNMPVKNPINPYAPDGGDFYFFVLKKDAQDVLFASTYGQHGGFTDHVDGGTSRFDPTGVIYEAICANCGGGTTFPTGPPGVYSRQNGSKRPGETTAGCNVAALKIAFDLDGVRGGVAPEDRRKMHCFEEQVSFIDTLYGRKAVKWYWAVFDTCDSLQVRNNPNMTPIASAEQDTGTVDDPYRYRFQFPAAGCYTVRMVKYNPNDCIEYDTSYTVVRIGDNPATLRAEAHKLRPCNSYRYQFDNLSTNAQNLAFGDSAFVWDFGDGSEPVYAGTGPVTHQFPGEGTYTVTLRLPDTAGLFCNTPQDTSIVVGISNVLQAVIQAPDTLCVPDEYLLGNASLGGTNFEWIIRSPAGTEEHFLKGDLSQLPYSFTEVGWYVITLHAEDTVCGTQDTAVDSVLAYPVPTAAFGFSPNDATNQVITFTNQSTSNFGTVDDGLTYFWDFGDGQTSTEKDPRHLYAQTGTFLVTLTTTNAGGCPDTATATVTETIIPKMDVPNAFTPNGDGRNDYIGPIAFGATSVDFRIYNRLGQLVFHSTDPQVAYVPEAGWDGTFKGKPQEMDVYAYTLQVKFNDGTTATKQGSITLLR